MTREPYAIDGPAMISFSGGRTSAYMLRRCMDVGLRDGVHVLFANTGKEREETLEFVRDVSERWGVPVTWLERKAPTDDAPASFCVVAFASASRNGEPFTALIDERNFLPNPVTRFCTQELKIRVMKKWMMAQGYEHWTNVVGFRYDEPGRVARIRASEGKERWDVAVPLYDDGVTREAVESFWNCQPFNLQLRPWEGNCDLCFLKGRAKRERIMRDRPDLVAWWAEAEAEARGARRRRRRSAATRRDTPR